MIFAPHILQVKVIIQMDKDEFGRPLPDTGGESWKDICKCRCDDIIKGLNLYIFSRIFNFL